MRLTWCFNPGLRGCRQPVLGWALGAALILAWTAGSAQASLEAYDAAIAEDEAGGLTPTARLAASVTLTGANRAAFDFGPVPGDATIEFILEGNPAANQGAYLAVGANTVSNLRYAQWANTRELGFTQLGVLDYRFSPPIASPTEPAHIVYVWDSGARTMRLYRGGTVAGTASGITPGFAMPTGQGWLGANPSGSEAMVGTIHRVTVYQGRLAEEVIRAHADAFAGIVRPPVIASFTATPEAVFTPGTTTLRWEVRNAAAVFLEGQEVTGEFSSTVAPSTTTRYTLVATNASARAEASVTVLVNPAPVIESFTAAPSAIAPGQPATLAWTVRYAWTLSVSPGIGDVSDRTVDGLGAVEVRPASSLDYTLSAASAYGSASASVSVRCLLPAHHLVISEFMADDQATLADEEGEHSGWIEIHNPTPATVDLDGHFLTDDAANPRGWGFPTLALDPGAYLVVFASGKDRALAGAPLHTNFRLNNGGEFLGLSGPGSVWLHAYTPAFPPQRADVAYGILAGDPAVEQYLGEPTPGAQNRETPPPPGPVVLSVPDRTFTGPFSVALSVDDPGAEIRYTLDGSLPGPTNGTLYTAPVAISTTTRMRAVAVRGGRSGDIRGACYIQLAPELASYTSPLPILVIDNFGAGTIRQKGWNGSGAGITQVPRQAAAWIAFERAGDRGALTDTPQMAGLIGIRGRGAYSTEWRQKPYSVEAIDEQGEEAEVSPLGLPAHADWVLYYPDSDQSRDPTLLFNTFAYELSRSMGHYAVRFRWVEAFINEDGGPLSLGDRRGVYALIEKVARGRDRLDFQRLATDGSTGGWLLNINRMDPEPETGWPAPNGAVEPWFFHTAGPDRVFQTQPNRSYSPVPGDDLPQQWNAYINFENPNGHSVNARQRAAIEGWFKQFEDVLYRDALWRHPTNGYRRYLDVRDFADYFVLNTLTRNGDGLLISLYPWKGDDGKLRIGPAWDYNWSSYYVSGGPTGSLMHRADQLWYPRLFADPDFAQDYIDRWWDLRRGPVSNAAMDAIVDRQASAITSEKALLNGLPSAAEWARRLDQMKTWLRQRADWIDSHYLPPPVFNRHGGVVPDGFQVVISGVGGTLYVTTDGTDPRAPGGAVGSGARISTAPVTVHSPVQVQARLKNGAQWSGLTAAWFLPPQDLGELALTEIMYHPPAAGRWESEDLEFVELRNGGASRLHLGALSFTAGITFTFTDGTQLDPGQFLVLVRNPEAFGSRYPGVPVHGAFSGRLDNSGETLRLATADGMTVFEVTYDDGDRWPAAADGSGRSLQRQAVTVDGSDPTDWAAAFPTPGADQLADADGDGQPDAWERAYGLDPADSNDRDLDRDNDGLLNGQEYQAGTDPTDPASCLRIDAVAAGAGTGVTLRFQAIGGQSYTLESRDGTGADLWSRRADIPSRSMDREEVLIDATPPALRYYRLVTPRRP